MGVFSKTTLGLGQNLPKAGSSLSVCPQFYVCHSVTLMTTMIIMGRHLSILCFILDIIFSIIVSHH